MIKLRFKVLACFVFLIGLNACINDDGIEIDSEELGENKVTLKRIYSNEIKENTSIATKLEEIKRSFTESTTSSRTEYNEDNDLFIDTEEAIYIEQEDYHSYTFYVFRDYDNGYIENLTLSLKSNNTYKTSLIQYPLDENNNIDEENVNIIDLEDLDTSSLLTRTIYTCQDGIIVIDVVYVGNNDGIIYDEPGDCINANSVGSANTPPCDTIFYYIPCHNNPTDIDAGDSTSNDGGSTNGDNGGNNNPPGGDAGNNNPGGGGTGDGSNPQGDDDTNNDGDGNDPNDDDTNDDSDDCILDANGECIQDMTSPILPKVDQKNCEELKKLGETLKIKQSYETLQANANSTTINQEFGFAYTLYFEPPTPLSSASESTLNPIVGTDFYAFSHTHPPKDSEGNLIFPMFSVEDIFNLARLKDSFSHENGASDNAFFVTLTVRNNGNYTPANPTNTYAVKINNWADFNNFAQYFNGLGDLKDDFADKLQIKYEENTSPNATELVSETYEPILFQFMFENNINGIDIFKATDKDLQNWQKLNYNRDENKMDDPTDCN